MATKMPLQIDGVHEPPKALSYTPEFLHAETIWPAEESENPPHDLRPVLNVEWDDLFQSVSRRSWKGFCCPKCGRLSCREHWAHLQCANESCDFTIVPKQRELLKPEHLEEPHAPHYTGPAIPQDHYGREIKVTKSVIDGYTVIQYQLGEQGVVTHMLGNKKINAREFGADWLFQEYQNAKMPFFRHKLVTQQGVTRTSHFTYNVGAQYNYVANQPTVTFEQAEPVVTKALELIKSNVHKLYPDVNFNEILNVGYFEAQKMSVRSLYTLDLEIELLILEISFIRMGKRAWEALWPLSLWAARHCCISASKCLRGIRFPSSTLTIQSV
jgi:hypothetical protein